MAKAKAKVKKAVKKQKASPKKGLLTRIFSSKEPAKAKPKPKPKPLVKKTKSQVTTTAAKKSLGATTPKESKKASSPIKGPSPIPPKPVELVATGSYTPTPFKEHHIKIRKDKRLTAEGLKRLFEGD